MSNPGRPDALALPTFEPSLLEAMLRYVRNKRGAEDAVAVMAYRERSFNLGYCETCSELWTTVRIWFNRRSGALDFYGYAGDFGQFIRDLTDEPAQRGQWEATAQRESEDERADSWYRHDFDEVDQP